MLKIVPGSIDWGEVGKKNFHQKLESDPAATLHKLADNIPLQLLNADWLTTHKITTKQHQYRLISVVISAAIHAEAGSSTAHFIHALAKAGVFSSLRPLDTQSCFYGLNPTKEKGMNDPCRLLGETLALSIRKKDETVASLLIDNNKINNELFFLKACKHNLPQVIKKIDTRLSPNSKTATHARGLVISCENGSLGALKALIEAGATPSADYNGIYPIHAACKMLQIDCLKALLPHLHAGDLNVREGMTGHTPLQVLFTQLERSYDMKKRAQDNAQILTMASLLLTHGAHPGAAFGAEVSILHDLCGRWTVFQSEVDFAYLLVKAGLDPLSKGRRGSPIERLFCSQPRGGSGLFKLLLMKGETPCATAHQAIPWIELIFPGKKTEFLQEFFSGYSSTLATLFLEASHFPCFLDAIQENASLIVQECKQNKQNPLELSWIMQQERINEAFLNDLPLSEIDAMEEEMKQLYPQRLSFKAVNF